MGGAGTWAHRVTLTRRPVDRRADFDRVQAWALGNLSALVEEYAGVELQHGRCACPLHGGDNPDAFSVTDGKGWHCHTGCGGIGGDGVDFVRRLRYGNLAEKEGRLAALRELAPRAGVTLEPWQDRRRGPARRPHRTEAALGMARRAIVSQNANTGHGSRVRRERQATQTPEEIQRAHALQDCACMGYVVQRAPNIYAAVLDVLTLGARGVDYLRARGFDPAAAARYGFRSLDSDTAWRELVALFRASYLPEELEATGWHTLPWGGKAPALVIPFMHRGDVIALRFRHLDTDERGAKYRALAGVTIAEAFNADALVLASGSGQTAAAHELHVVEGELNAYALTLHGLRAIGLPGAGKWRDEWAETIATAVETHEAGRLVTWYDDDRAGETGRKKLAGALQAVRGRAWLTRHGRAVMLRGADANELHRTGQLHALTARAPWRD